MIFWLVECTPVRVIQNSVEFKVSHTRFLHTHNSTGIRFIRTKVASAGRTTFIFHCVKIFFAANE